MEIKDLDDLDAFLLMLKLLLKIFTKIDDNLIRYLFRFCGLDTKLIDSEELKNEIKRLFKERSEYLNDKKYVEIKANCLGLDYDDNYYCILIKIGQSSSYSCFLKDNDSNSIYLPIQIGRIQNESIQIKIVQITKEQFLAHTKPGKAANIVIYDNLKINFKDIAPLSSLNLEIKYDENQKKYCHKAKKDSIKINNLKSITKLKTIMNLKMKSKLDLKSNSKFDLQFNWFPFNPFDFINVNTSIKNQLTKNYHTSIEQHLKLMKYLIKNRIEQVKNPKFFNELFSNLNLDKFFGNELNLIVNQSLFEGALSNLDHLICIRQVCKELENDLKFKEIDFNKLPKKQSLQSTEILSSLTNESQEFLSFIVNPFDYLNQPLPIDLPFKPILSQREAKLSPTANQLKPFDFEKMKYQFLNDFDFISSKVIIWVTSSFNNTPRFCRFSSEKSLNLFSYNNPLRKLCISISTSVSYRIYLSLYIIFEFFCFAYFAFNK